MENLPEIVSNLGFPIACVCAMFFMWNKEREDHKDEVKELTAAVNNNTVVMEKILTALEKDGEE